MEKTKSTAFQIITTFGTKIILLFGSFIVSVLLARLLGPEGKGIITAIFIVPNLIVSLADLGVRQASAYFIGKKIYPIEEVLSSSLFLWFISSTLSIGIVLAYYSASYVEDYGWLLIAIALSTIPINLLITYLTGIMQGTQRIGTINLNALLNFVVNFSSVILLVWFFKLGVLGGALVNLVVIMMSLFYLSSNIIKISKIRIKYIKPIPQELFKKGITYSLALFILNLNYRVDIIFLEKLTSASEVGIYSVGTSLAELIWQLPAAVSLVLFSKSANSKNDIEARNRAAKILRMSLPILSLICIVFALISKFFVTIIYGQDFRQSAEIINILLPGVLIITISKILHPDMAARGYPLYGLFAFIGPLIVNVLLNIIWVPQYGMYGAAWASTISYSIGGLIYGMVYAKKEGLRLRDLLIIKIEDILMIRKSILAIKNKIIKKKLNN